MNVMTEEEARGKGCPFMRFSPTCSASNCMAWRWVWSGSWEAVDGSDVLSHRRVPSSTHGYCGLAGSPTP